MEIETLVNILLVAVFVGVFMWAFVSCTPWLQRNNSGTTKPGDKPKR